MVAKTDLIQSSFRHSAFSHSFGPYLQYGKVIYLDSAQDGASDGNTGLANDQPAATFDGAVNKCTANAGYTILVAPTHSETQTAQVNLDVAGITVIFLGEGTNRGQLTVGAAIDGIDVSADNCTLVNPYFNEATASATSNINVDAANFKLVKPHMDLGANDVDAITVTANGENFKIYEMEAVVTANGPDSLVKFEGVVDGFEFKDGKVIGSDGTNAFDDGIFDFNSQAVTNPSITGNTFLGGGVATTVIANDGSVVGAHVENNKYGGGATHADIKSLKFATGEADVDVSESDYTTVGGIALLTITPATGQPLYDVVIDLDLLKTTTGLLAVNTTETVQLMVQSKIDGTNWRTVQGWPAASSTTGLTVPDAAQDLDALDDSPAHRFVVGNIGPTQEVRITIQLSAETGGDAEIPYVVQYRGATPTITAVAAA